MLHDLCFALYVLFYLIVAGPRGTKCCQLFWQVCCVFVCRMCLSACACITNLSCYVMTCLLLPLLCVSLCACLCVRACERHWGTIFTIFIWFKWSQTRYPVEYSYFMNIDPEALGEDSASVFGDRKAAYLYSKLLCLAH